MQKKKMFQWIWLFSILAIAGLSCNTINQIGRTSATAQAVITQVKGIATQGESLVNTAQAFATREFPGLWDTAAAYATQNPGLVSTAQAFITQEAPKLASTAQAWATQNPQLRATGNALMTRAAGGEEAPQIPEGIPVLPADQIKNLYASPGYVSYFTTRDFKDVVNYYKGAMVANGWEIVPKGTVETDSVSVLNYKMPNRAASVVISQDLVGKRTAVVITLQQK